MKYNLLLSAMLLCTGLTAQNVGIGNNNPQHTLDVGGDINLTGKLLTNGTQPGAGKMLRTNNNGVMQWADISQYQNHETFTSLSASSWTIPEGVTKIMVEAWGGGGGGSCAAGGGGGGYICGYFTVTPGSSITFDIGAGGSGSNCETTASNHAETTTVTVNGVVLRALQGLGSYRYGTANYWLGRGGSYSVSPTTFRNFMGASGEDGSPNDVEYKSVAAGVARTVTKSGRGGNAGNTMYTGGLGGYIEATSATVALYVTGGSAKLPGGGGSGNTNISTVYYGAPGAAGMVVFHY